MMKKQWIYALALAAALNFSTAEATYTPPKVPEDIYEWVQSSERMNYFFNKQEMSYGVDAKGYVDLETLVVPVIKTYDHVQIEDVRMKRSWRMESTDALTDLAGEANYLTINIPRGVVTVDAVDLIDSKFWTVEHAEPKKEVVIADLTEKSRDGIFYRAILAYEKDHRRDILSHTKGTLTEEEQEKFEKEEKHHEKEMKKRKEKEEREKKEKEQQQQE
jgi:hypothetical protein